MFGTVAIVGATGAVGRIMLRLLEERGFQAESFKFLASPRSGFITGEIVDINGGLHLD